MVDSRHFIAGVEFTPVNIADFEFVFEATAGDEWKQDVTASSRVILPQEGYVKVLNHLKTIGVQQAIEYNLMINDKNYPCFVDLYDNLRIYDSKMGVGIKRFKSKDNVLANLENTTYEWLYQSGYISTSDFVKIPYVVIKDNQGEMLINTAIMIYVMAQSLADSIATTTRLIADLIASVTPSIVAPVGATINVGMIIRYSLLIVLEVAKTVMLTIALRQLTKQLFELIYGSLRNYNGMTFDKLLKIGLGSQNLTYQSSLSDEFKKCTVIPVPIDEKKKKWFEVADNLDDRILNRGYPTASDTVPTPTRLIEEICKIYNVQPYLRGNVLHLEPKGWLYTQPYVKLQHNKNDQENIENSRLLDLSGVWNTRIISYINDSSDLMTFDNPKGLRSEWKSRPNNLSPLNELTTIKGLQDFRINFALGAIKKETFLEKELKKVAKVVDRLLGTNNLSKLKKREGVLAVSQSQFSVTKIIYQQNGKQLANFYEKIGSESLGKYRTIDDPKNNIWLIFEDMPIVMNNNLFSGIIENNIVSLEGKMAEIMSCSYNPRLGIANSTYRMNINEWGKNIETNLIYSE